MKSNTGKYLKVAALVWSGCFIIFLLVFFAILGPLNKRRIQIETEFKKVEAEAAAASLASQEQTKNRLNEEIRTSNERLGDFVFAPERTSNLTYEIGSIFSGIGLDGFEVTPTGQSIAAFDGCKYASGQYYQVSFTASFNEFAAFLNALERYRPVIFVDTFTITRSSQGDSEPKVDMQLAVLVAKNGKARDAKS